LILAGGFVPDVVVIGGGLGGLSAAVAMSRAGLSVRLLEKEPRLGGYAVAFSKAGFRFDVALHVVPEGGPDGLLRHLFEMLGVEDSLQFLPLTDGLSVSFGLETMRLPNDWEGLFQSLTAHFPGQTKGLNRLKADLEWRDETYRPLFDPRVPRKTSVPPFLFRVPGFLRLAAISTEAYLRRFIDDPSLAARLFQASVFYGIPADAFPALNFVFMFTSLFRHGMYTIDGGGEAVSKAMGERCTLHGVDLRTCTIAEKVTIENGRVTGVLDRSGELHEAKAVVAGVNLPYLVDTLLPQNALPTAYRSRLSSLKPSVSLVQLQLGLDKSPKDCGVETYLALHFPNEDLPSCLRRQRQSLMPEGFSMTSPSHLWPRAGNVVCAVGGVDGAGWCALSPEEYPIMKDRAKEHLLKALGRAYPDLLGSVEVLDMATPATFHRYTNCPDGAVMGFDPSLGSHRLMRRVSTVPVKGLFLASAWSDQFGGFMPSIRAGIHGARKVLRWCRR
jgi:phytoene dehydrogenase-like protein